MMETELLLAANKCGQCLTTPNRIVPSQRASEIIRDCMRNDVHFQCHKGSAAGLNVYCRGVHEVRPSQAYRFALACRIPIREVDPDSLPAHRDADGGAA